MIHIIVGFTITVVEYDFCLRVPIINSFTVGFLSQMTRISFSLQHDTTMLAFFTFHVLVYHLNTKVDLCS